MERRKIEESIGHWLLLLSRTYRRRIQEQLSDLGLFAGQDILLMYLWEQDGQTQSELASRMQIQQATLTRMITRMANTGLVTRKPDRNDGRVSRVFLTNACRKLRDPVEQIWIQIENQIFSGLTLEERLLLRRLLMQLQVELGSD